MCAVVKMGSIFEGLEACVCVCVGGNCQCMHPQMCSPVSIHFLIPFHFHKRSDAERFSLLSIVLKRKKLFPFSVQNKFSI